MASPSVTYTFTNGTTADATQVNQNFTDLVNGLSDGTKDLSISALTAAGNTTLNGNTTLGNASSDDLTVTASLASTIPIKTTATYDIGSSTKGLLGLYLGNSTFTTKLATGATASWTFTLPATAGIAGQSLINAGSGTVEWKYMTAETAAKSADYTVTDTDKIRTVLVTAGASTRTITLPTAADNAHRMLTISKIDSGAGIVVIDGENSETINGAATFTLYGQNESVTIQCDGSAWYVLNLTGPQVQSIRLYGSNGYGSSDTKIRQFDSFSDSYVGSPIITLTANATNGNKFTAVEKCEAFIAYADGAGSGGSNIGISLNATTTTNIDALSETSILCYVTPTVANLNTLAQWSGKLAAGDVVRCHTEGAAGISDARTRCLAFFRRIV